MRLADERALQDRALECLEKALDAEFRSLPEVVDLRAVRADYGRLLNQYKKLAEAMLILKVRPAPDFLGKVVRAADRWRALDRDQADPALKAASIMHRLGEAELGWDYLTTPMAVKPNEADSWLGMAATLSMWLQPPVSVSGSTTGGWVAVDSVANIEPRPNLRFGGSAR